MAMIRAALVALCLIQLSVGLPVAPPANFPMPGSQEFSASVMPEPAQSASQVQHQAIFDFENADEDDNETMSDSDNSQPMPQMPMEPQTLVQGEMPMPADFQSYSASQDDVPAQMGSDSQSNFDGIPVPADFSDSSEDDVAVPSYADLIKAANGFAAVRQGKKSQSYTDLMKAARAQMASGSQSNFAGIPVPADFSDSSEDDVAGASQSVGIPVPADFSDSSEDDVQGSSSDEIAQLMQLAGEDESIDDAELMQLVSEARRQRVMRHGKTGLRLRGALLAAKAARTFRGRVSDIESQVESLDSELNEHHSSEDHSSDHHSSEGHSSEDHSSEDHSSEDHSSEHHSSEDHSSEGHVRSVSPFSVSHHEGEEEHRVPIGRIAERHREASATGGRTIDEKLITFSVGERHIEEQPRIHERHSEGAAEHDGENFEREERHENPRQGSVEQEGRLRDMSTEDSVEQEGRRFRNMPREANMLEGRRNRPSQQARRGMAQERRRSE